MARNHVKMGRIIMCRGNVTRGKEQCVHVWQFNQVQVADFVARP